MLNNSHYKDIRTAISLSPICPICKKINSNKTRTVAHTPNATVCMCKECDTFWALAKNGNVGYKILKNRHELSNDLTGFDLQ